MSQRGAEWYHREPRAFLEGVRGLTEREIAVYAVVLDLIYDGGHETRDDPKHIASYFADLGKAAVRNAVDRLVELGKLERNGENLTNKRAKNEGKTREELRKTRQDLGRLGGVSSGKSRARTKENKDLSEAKAAVRARDREEGDKIREDNTSSNDDVVAADVLEVPERYAFQAQTIKLTEKDLGKWRKAFPHLSLEAELWALDDWAGKEKKNRWFPAVSGALAKKEREATDRINAAAARREQGGEAKARPNQRI